MLVIIKLKGAYIGEMIMDKEEIKRAEASQLFRDRRLYSMQTQTIQFAVVTKNGVVQKVGKSTISQPKTNFKGGSIKWYEDKKKADK